MMNYQLRKLENTMEQTLCGSNWIYVIRRKGQKENFNLKSVTMIYPVTGWSEITQYDDKIVI